MSPDAQKALLTIALYAAFADGNKAESEREAIRDMAESLTDGSGGHPLSKLYQDVLLKRVSVAQAVAALQDPAHRQLAYEMAVCVCDADGSQSDAERQFLAQLRQQLALDGAQQQNIKALETQADAIAAYTDTATSMGAPSGISMGTVAAVAAGTGLATAAAANAWGRAADAGPAATPAYNPAPAPAPAYAPNPAVGADLDKSILNYAILNGALELLPQSWASMAIIPLQIKMVYAIGKAHGVELDQGHIKEFIATAGVGLTSQYLEQFGRKLLGGLLGKALGGTMGKVGGVATGMAFSFATTYALGHLAKRYYAGGRSMNTEVLRSTYQSLLGPAQKLQTEYLPQIRERASTLDAGKIMSMVKGGV
jgi:uncharacterized protein (DUF697 family)/tellurite resistance protein